MRYEDKKNFGQNFGKTGLSRLLFGRFSAIFGRKPTFEKKIMVFLAIFEKIWGLFFSKTFFGLKSPRNAWKWFLTSSLGPKDDWDLILDHF